MTYSILFIDEEKSSHRTFIKNFINNNKEKFTGTAILPAATLEEMIEIIFELNPDAVLTDYSLNEHKRDLIVNYTVEYSGGDLAQEILSRRKNFPVFIATSFAIDAAHQGHDVKRIYEKQIFQEPAEAINQTHQHLTFRDRLLHEIISYKKYLDLCSDNFDRLICKKRSTEGLTLLEEEELIKVDKILEASIDQHAQLPDDLRNTSNTQKLESLLNIAKELLEKVK